MHDFIQTLSFRSGDRQIAGVSDLTIAATKSPLFGVMNSFNEVPAYRPVPRTAKTRKSAARLSHKS